MSISFQLHRGPKKWLSTWLYNVVTASQKTQKKFNQYRRENIKNTSASMVSLKAPFNKDGGVNALEEDEFLMRHPVASLNKLCR